MAKAATAKRPDVAKQRAGDDGYEEEVVDTEANRTWHPAQDDPEHVLVCELAGKKTIETRYGARTIRTVVAQRAGEDGDGDYTVGTRFDVFMSAGLAGIKDFPAGTLLKIVPAGWGGKDDARKVFRVTKLTPKRRKEDLPHHGHDSDF